MIGYPEKRDLDWLLFNKKRFKGCYIVQFECQKNFERICDVGIISEIKMNDFFLELRVADRAEAWLYYQHDAIQPDVTEEDNNIVIEDKILDLKFIIVKINKSS